MYKKYVKTIDQSKYQSNMSAKTEEGTTDKFGSERLPLELSNGRKKVNCTSSQPQPDAPKSVPFSQLCPCTMQHFSVFHTLGIGGGKHQMAAPLPSPYPPAPPWSHDEGLGGAEDCYVKVLVPRTI